jgi:hypothetical protein
MDKLRFEVPLDDLAGFRADAVLGDSIFEVLVQPRDLRRLKASLMDIARYSSGLRKRRGILVLDEPEVSESRLHEQWASLQQIFRPEILGRLALVIHREGVPDQVFGQLGRQDLESIPAIIDHARQHSPPKSKGPVDTFYDILRILLNQWIKRAGPLTSRWIGDAAGCTYPTVASALKKLEKYLIRQSDRRVELKVFPKDEWFRLVANADKVRQTLRFADHSGQPRSIESLLSRFERIRPEKTAIGGVLGARRMFPALDLIGTPRIDVSIHSRTGKPDLGFLRQLDPALKLARYDEPARLVVHTLRYPHCFFESTPDGTLWADPVECLLDLHEMRLESQAAELLHFLTPS